MEKKIQAGQVVGMTIGVLFILIGLTFLLLAHGCTQLGSIIPLAFGGFAFFVCYRDRFTECSDF